MTTIVIIEPRENAKNVISDNLHVTRTYGGGKFAVIPGFSDTPKEILHKFSRSAMHD